MYRHLIVEPLDGSAVCLLLEPRDVNDFDTPGLTVNHTHTRVAHPKLALAKYFGRFDRVVLGYASQQFRVIL